MLFRRYYKTEKGTLLIDGLILKSPVFGPLLKKVAVARFTRTMSTMMTSGVPILEGLAIVSKTAGNKIVENALIGLGRASAKEKPSQNPCLRRAYFRRWWFK